MIQYAHSYQQAEKDAAKAYSDQILKVAKLTEEKKRKEQQQKQDFYNMPVSDTPMQDIRDMHNGKEEVNYYRMARAFIKAGSGSATEDEAVRWMASQLYEKELLTHKVAKFEKESGFCFGV